jgi:hypothetical protein
MDETTQLADGRFEFVENTPDPADFICRIFLIAVYRHWRSERRTVCSEILRIQSADIRTDGPFFRDFKVKILLNSEVVVFKAK